MKIISLTLALAMAFAPAAQAAADKVTVGFITTLSGPEAVMGNPMRDSANLALEMLGGKLGGVPAEIIYGDDETKPDIGRQIAEKMLDRYKVDFITGMLGSQVLLAVQQKILRSKTILISANAGPHQLAGELCSPYFFATSGQSDIGPEAMGQYLTSKDVSDVYILAPNFNAGKDMLAGFKRYFKGNVIGETYTALGQMDYQSELSQIKAAHPKAVFAFYPGSMGIQFTKQYADAGLRGQIPLYSVGAVDEGNLPALQEAALGDYTAFFWSANLDTARNKMYVDAFRKKFGYTPSSFGAGSFDAIFLIDSAIRAVHGDLADKKGMIAAMEKADFPSVRGPFAFNTNHFPIENYYLFRVATDAQGQYGLNTEMTVFTAHKDHYYGECKMPAE